MRKILLFSLVIIVALSSCKSLGGGSSSSKSKRETSNSRIAFEEGMAYNKVLSMAQNDFKPVFIDFYTDWCGPCKWMDKDVFQTEAAGQYFNKNLINLKVNAEKGEGVELAQRYKINAYPTVVYVDPFGNEITRHVGMTTASKIINLGKKAVAETDKLKAATKNTKK